MTIRTFAAALLILSSTAFGSAAWAQSVAGLWDATITVNDHQIPFRLEFSGDGSSVKGWFFNGDQREISTSGSYENGSLVLNFDSYAAVLTLKFQDGTLDGEYATRNRPQHVHAVRAEAHPPSSVKVPDVAGLWFLENVPSSKGEKAWNLILKQQGDEIRGSILRVDGDTGTLEGRYQDGKFVLSHFDGARPALIIVTPQGDGTLSVDLVSQRNGGSLTAYRADEARAKGLPLPTDPDQHTGVKDAEQPFPFRFPDLNGKIVSSTDPRFQGKVVLINITGSWCPNCHDEAPFLAEVYQKYHSQGLEIVALSFEEAEQLKNPARLRAFIKEYGIKYTVLLGGETSSAKEKLTQAQNWDAWPTTFFVGRDGLVRSVHAGFPSPGSGELYKHEKQEFVATVERLLAENESARK